MEYASRSLTDTETRYAQTEKEMLAIVFVLERFNQHTFGRHVYIEGDHKPLEMILQKPLARAPRRLQLVMMRLQKFHRALRARKKHALGQHAVKGVPSLQRQRSRRHRISQLGPLSAHI